jgi:hypothetical protein
MMRGMSRNEAGITVERVSREQRRLARKTVLLDAVLAEADGETAVECIIRDIHAQGAAISITKKFPIGAHVFLLDAGNAIAHECRVAWSRSDRSGLQFMRSYAMGLGLPPKLKFLWRLLFAVKLRQVERAIGAEVPIELALNTAGLTRERMRQMARHAAGDAQFQRLLRRAAQLLGA